jgi:hypothetical protein
MGSQGKGAADKVHNIENGHQLDDKFHHYERFRMPEGFVGSPQMTRNLLELRPVLPYLSEQELPFVKLVPDLVDLAVKSLGAALLNQPPRSPHDLEPLAL